MPRDEDVDLRVGQRAAGAAARSRASTVPGTPVGGRRAGASRRRRARGRPDRSSGPRRAERAVRAVAAGAVRRRRASRSPSPAPAAAGGRPRCGRPGRRVAAASDEQRRRHAAASDAHVSSGASGALDAGARRERQLCMVAMRSVRAMTNPATRPKAICEATNQGQSMRALSVGIDRRRATPTAAPVHSSGATMPPQKLGRRGNIGSSARVEQADEERDRSRGRRWRRASAVRVEARAAASGRRVASAGIADRGEQIDRVPDAAVGEQAVEQRQRRHRDAAGEAAPDAGRVRDGSRPAGGRGAAASPAARCCDARAATARSAAPARRRGTASTCSSGSTSRNQPTAPATMSTTPTTLTSALVTRPAKASVMPSAATIGHARRRGNVDRARARWSWLPVAISGRSRRRRGTPPPTPRRRSASTRTAPRRARRARARTCAAQAEHAARAPSSSSPTVTCAAWKPTSV